MIAAFVDIDQFLIVRLVRNTSDMERQRPQWAGVGAGLLVLIIWYAFVGPLHTEQQTEIVPKPESPKSQEIVQPDRERAFIKLIIDADRSREVPYKRHDNIEFDRLIGQFHDDLCRFSDSLHVEQWVGKVSDSGTSDDRRRGLSQPLAKSGYAYLTVEIDDHGHPGAIELRTEAYDAVIEEGTPVFDAVRKLNKGDEVTFSGDFFRDDKTCLENASSIMGESLVTNTTFYFRFSSLRPSR